VQLTGFLNKQAQPFVAELWKLLLDAQDAPHGIPRAFVERKKAELVKRRAEGGERRARSRSRSRDRGGREAAQRSVVRAARGRSRSRSRERRKKRSGFSSAPAAPAPADPPPGKPALPPPWRWKESRSTPGDYYCVNEKTGERRWQAPSESKPKRNDDKVTVVHCLLKHADSRRPSSHRTPKISLAKSDARNEADALRERVAASSDMEAALSDEASKRSDCPSSTNGGRLKPFQRGDLERAFEAAAFRLAVGELSPVVETAAGFHVVLRKS
jgi:NIMA-interacting peptidyl-prolyl cis-trans isomerase 1